VTGLIVEDTATYFTSWGQAYILLLIQLGGLGIITFTSLIISAFGFRPSLRQETITRSTAEVAPHIDHQRLTRHIILFTFASEALGMILLYVFWIPDLGLTGALWPAFFHSISAFCNAGFSVFSDSLMGFQGRSFLLLVVMALIVFGGVGFLALEELYLQQKARRSRHSFRLSLHTRVVLVTTGVLLTGGWLLLTLFEWQNTLDGMPLADKLVNGLFMSVTPRTAGFNTVDYGQAANSTNFLTILLMSIGGAPGSTAGGLKVTTVALIGLVAWSRMRGYRLIHVWDRTVPEETIQRSIGLFVVAFGIVTAAIFTFTWTEISWTPYTDAAGFLPFMFEAVSAFNTVGLSMGETGDLSNPGRVTTIIMMFVGRVGPLTFAASLARRRARISAQFRYAHEDVAIG
jgi:trk system potassium uptake protein TrkH